jgi:hypothetical protein
MPPDGEFVVTGEMVANRKGRVYEAKAAVQDAGEVTFATATGKYRPIKNADVSEMAADLVGRPDWFRHPAPPV